MANIRFRIIFIKRSLFVHRNFKKSSQLIDFLRFFYL